MGLPEIAGAHSPLSVQPHDRITFIRKSSWRQELLVGRVPQRAAEALAGLPPSGSGHPRRPGGGHCGASQGLRPNGARKDVGWRALGRPERPPQAESLPHEDVPNWYNSVNG